MNEETKAPDLLEGTTIANGRYQIVRRIGAGGMGAVYQACQVAMGRMVALKLIHPHLGDSNEEMVGRFFQEMRASAAVEHSNTIRVYDFGETEGRLFLAMEYLEGRTLRHLLESEAPLPEDRVVAIAVQIAKALGAVHHEGVVHRDLKPENIMLLDKYGERDFVKVLDFGIARSFDDAQKQMTITGTVIGTPAYMSPEQASGSDLDGRSDLYSLGIVLFKMVTGQLPFDKPDLMSLLMAQINQPPPPVINHAPNLSPGMASLIMQLLAKDPNARPATADVISILYSLQAGPIPLGGAGSSVRHPVARVPEAVQTTQPIAQPKISVSGSLSGQIYGAKKKRRKWLVFAATILVLAGSFGLAAVWHYWKAPAAQILGIHSSKPEQEARLKLLRAEIDHRLISEEIIAPIDCQAKQADSLERLVRASKSLFSDEALERSQQALMELEGISENVAEKWALMARARFLPGTAGEKGAKQRAILSLHSAERAVALCPHYAGAHYLLGRAAQVLGKKTKAKDAFARSYGLNSNYLPTQFNMALLQMEEGDLSRAIDGLSGLIFKSPGYPHVFTLRGEAHFRNKDWKKAASDFEEAVSKNSKDCEALLGLGKSHLAKTKLSLAADALVKALECDRKDGRIWFFLGETFLRTQDFKEANKAFCRAKDLGVKEAASRCKR